MKFLGTLLVVLLLLAGGGWYFAGRSAHPLIAIDQPLHAIGQRSPLSATITTPDAALSRLEVRLEQNGRQWPIFSLANAQGTALRREGSDRLVLTQTFGKQSLPELQPGHARLVLTAGRRVLFGLRELSSSASRDLDVRLVPPTLGIASTHHYINQGGSELVVYRVTPADVSSGVRVGDRDYPGFPAAGADPALKDPSLRVALFALLWNQDPQTPITVYARDEASNETHAALEHRVFDKKFRQSRIPLTDALLARIVPPILQNTPELKVDRPADLLGSYLRINRELRHTNDAMIRSLARQSAPRMLWQGPFRQLGNSAVEAGFADQRSYVYNAQVVDQQVHLGFDLASTANTPVVAANSGRVVQAGWLGIYGNCVIVDHGMGLQSLYGHLSSIEVKVGDTVAQNQRLGRSGSTGLAGGDHLHFTILLDGNPVTPIDWWSPQWVQDRIVRKLAEAKGAG